MNSLFLDLLAARVVILDGAMGTSTHALHLPDSDYRGCENCPEILNLSRPDAIESIHADFLRVGCDAVETNTFGGARIVLAEFGLADRTREINRAAAQIARRAADKFATPDHPRFVLGSIGPGTKLPSLGQATFDEIEASHLEQALGLLDGGVDAIIIETCQDLLQCKAAICAATRAMRDASRRVPLIVQVTMETTGTMLLGSEIGAALAMIEAYPQVHVIGLNCATGPREMSEHVRFLSQNCRRPISVVPNAGLPQLVDGRTHYALTPAELARWLGEFVEADGVNIVGGCCGTTPEHMAAVVEAIGRRPPGPRNPRGEPSVSSLYQACAIRQDNSFLIVGERTNANGSKKFRELLQAEDIEGMVAMAREQARHGAHVLDVCAAYVGRDEVADMTRLIRRFRTDVTLPLMIDSTEPPVIEAALKLLGGKCIINSINLEDGEERMEKICPLAARFGAALVALTIDERGMAKSADEKVAVARRIHDLATQRYGIAPHDLLFDPLTFTIATGNEDDRRLGLETLAAIRRIKRELPGAHTLLGVSNISFGLRPAARHVLNSVFLHHAREAGLDAAIVHAAGIQPLYKIDARRRDVAEDLIYDRRRPPSTDEPDGYDPLKVFLSLFPEEGAAKQEKKARGGSIEERLKNRIIDGDKQGLDDDLDEAMQRYAPLDIINNVLLDGMKVVGDLFAAGQMQLPFVLASAETMKAAVTHLEPHMSRVDGSSKGRIVLATVKGDVHDIGKNLVDIILRNNGYTVFNLGIKQPINQILEAFEREKADAIGLSGLLVKSTLVMRDDLHVLNERSITAPVILGGAALTRKYVEEDLRAIYKGPLFYAKDAFEGLHLMDRIRAPDFDPAAATARPSARPRVVTAAQPLAGPGASNIRRDVTVPTPPFWGSRVIEEIPLRAVLAYINEVMLFQVQWQYKRRGRSEGDFEAYLKQEVRPVFNELVERCARERILQPRAIYGYWPANSDGNDLIIYEPPENGSTAQAGVPDATRLRPDKLPVLTRLTFPRQDHAPFWCLSDFWRPAAGGAVDVVGLMIVTVGQQASDTARQWFEADRYRDYLHLHGLGVETAEALAEYLHRQIRMELGISGADARDMRKLFQQGYQGCRYSFGYPACPDLEDHVKIWPLLRPERIGVTLSEEFQLHPEQSTSAIVAHHPEARYFNVRTAREPASVSARPSEGD